MGDDERETRAIRPGVGLSRVADRAQGFAEHGRGGEEGAVADQAEVQGEKVCDEDGGQSAETV